LEGPLECPLKGPLENNGATDTGRSFLYEAEAEAEAEAEPPRPPSGLASGLGHAGIAGGGGFLGLGFGLWVRG
jgi:hypothetical protein